MMAMDLSESGAIPPNCLMFAEYLNLGLIGANSPVFDPIRLVGGKNGCLLAKWHPWRVNGNLKRFSKAMQDLHGTACKKW